MPTQIGVEIKTISLMMACAAVFLVACAPLPQAPASSSMLQDEVTAFLKAYSAAISSRDAARIRNSYIADDRFVWIEDGKVRYRKVDEVLAGLATFPAGSPIRTEFKDVTVVPLSQSAAHAWATFRTSVGEGSTGFSFGGAISFALERQGTEWKVVGGHTSSPSRR